MQKQTFFEVLSQRETFVKQIKSSSQDLKAVSLREVKSSFFFPENDLCQTREVLSQQESPYFHP